MECPAKRNNYTNLYLNYSETATKHISTVSVESYVKAYN